MSEMVERAAKAIFDARFNHPEDFWPHRIDEIVTGPPFDADGYRDMARAVIEAMREPTEQMLTAEEVHPSCHMCGGHLDGRHNMIDAALKSSDQ